MNLPVNHRARNKLVLRVVVLLIVLAAVWLKPHFEKWSGTAPAASTETNGTGYAPDGSDLALATESGRKPGTSDELADVFTPEAPANARPPGDRPRLRLVESDESAIAADAGKDNAKRQPTDGPRPGDLELIGDNIFRSTEGLIYRPGSRDGHRLKHILKHAKDDPSKPIHGVFEGDREQILEWIDVAWKKARKGGKGVSQRKEGDRTAWTVKMHHVIGFAGGQEGARRKHPECRYLRLVIEDESTVVTAYPVYSN